MNTVLAELTVDVLHAEAVWRVREVQFSRATFADARYRTNQTSYRVSRAYRRLCEAHRGLTAAEDRKHAAVLAERSSI